MSFIPTLKTTLGVAFIVATAGAVSVSAQTQAVADNSSTNAPANASRTSELKTSSNPQSTVVPAESRAPENSAQTKPQAGSAEVVDVSAVTSVPTAAAKAARSAETVVPQGTSTNKWQFQFSPYFWLASLHGTGGIGNRTTQVDESFSDIFHSLDLALMGLLEARKGKFVTLTDVEYVAVSDNKATPGPLFSNVNAKFKTFIFDPEAGYRVLDHPDKGAFVDVLGGVRVWHVSTDLAFGAGILPATEVQGSRNWVDGVVGLRGKAALSPKLFITGKFDLGGGGSKFTYQVFGGGGYNVNKKVALIFGYRILDVNYNKNGFVYDMNQRGPIMGLGFKF